jgi:hypothetical protein
LQTDEDDITEVEDQMNQVFWLDLVPEDVYGNILDFLVVEDAVHFSATCNGLLVHLSCDICWEQHSSRRWQLVSFHKQLIGTL